MAQNKLVSRLNYGEIKEVREIPDLIEVQLQSYKDFLQSAVLPEDRRDIGLQAIFKEIFPIKSYDESRALEFVGYSLGAPKYDVIEAQRRGVTYSAVLKVLLRLKEEGNLKEENIYLGNLPLMTEAGTFIINGAERVIVSQLHRSPGICFEKTIHPTKKNYLYSFRTIPNRGSWLEVQFDINDLIYIYVDRKKRRKKVLATTFMRAIGYSTDEAILSQFLDVKMVNLNKKTDIKKDTMFGCTIYDKKGKNVLVKAGQKVTKSLLEKLKTFEVTEIKVLEGIEDTHPIIKMLKKDPSDSQETALKDIYRKLRPGDPPTLTNAKALIKRLFFDKRRYDLGRVGRYKLNQKLNIEDKNLEDVTVLRKEDIVEAIKYLLALREGEGRVDDIDHLGNRRVRTVGELLQNQCRVGLARIERLVKERMNFYDIESETVTPHKLINPKGFSTVIKDFFGRSQLSQFMDQTNLLAEMTHKRRLSALGPGGLNRERAGFEVRDVHSSHYGRICPIETPEGPNIGLISSISAYAKINEYGFIVTPYRKVEHKKVLSEVEYLTADQEEKYIIAQSNIDVDKDGKIKGEKVYARCKGDFMQVSPSKVQFVDVSPKQLVSVAAGLIPFLEHDDANRALMGSNMQRQSVPLLKTEEPLVGTGFEHKAALDSRSMIVSDVEGEVKKVSDEQIIVGTKTFRLKKFMRSNSGTCINQIPVVKRGDKIKVGDVLADGPATKNGELALGRNALVAFMPWCGYNFEDAILVSEKLIKEDYYTSVHIEEFEIGCRDTKLGREEITRDIPNVGEEALRNLGEDGVIRIGAEIKPGDILVGKITPKSETELSPEERLLRAIFGEKAADVRDASLTVPPGTEGIVMDVRVFSRKDAVRTEGEKASERKEIKRINEEFKAKEETLKEEKAVQIKELLEGKKFLSCLVDSKTGEVIVEAKHKITKKDIEKIKEYTYGEVEIDKCELGRSLKRVLMNYESALDDLLTQHSKLIENSKRGDELEPGVIKQVKVYIAIKRKLSVGDKMAGRHGNKGVIARILPEEDMPFLPDGTPIQIVLNPLGVPSRMNVGQVLETFSGWAAYHLGLKIQTPVFDGMSLEDIKNLAKKAALPTSGKTKLYDGRTGEMFDQEVLVGYIYMMKLSHIAADKIHARAIGPYSLVTQQPLGGKAQFGGQRFGEMEVWALEAYGAAYTLQELLTVKSDDVVGRTKVYESIVKNINNLEAGTPESFNVLIKEMQSLGLDVKVEKN